MDPSEHAEPTSTEAEVAGAGIEHQEESADRMDQRSPSRRRISLGQILTIVANAGVVLGLIFVGLELQQTRVSLQAEVELTLAQSYQVLMGRTVENPYVAEIILKANTQPDALEPVEFIGILAWTAEALNLAFAAWQLNELGAIEESTYRQHVGYIAASFQTEFMRGLWRDNLGLYPEEFQMAMVELLSGDPAVFDTIQVREMIGN